MCLIQLSHLDLLSHILFWFFFHLNDNYYTTNTKMISIGQQNSSAGPSQIKNSAKHSKKLPYWLWFIIAKSLGIKLHPNDKPLVSVVLHGITLFSGGIMLLTRIWFSGKYLVVLYLYLLITLLFPAQKKLLSLWFFSH